jgi:hypothetical protein
MEYNFGMAKAGGSKFGMKKVWETILGFLAFGKNQQGVGALPNNLKTLIPKTQGKKKTLIGLNSRLGLN